MITIVNKSVLTLKGVSCVTVALGLYWTLIKEIAMVN